MKKIFSRLGDGWAIELTEAELMKDIVDGSTEAARDAGVDPLSDDNINHIFDICKNVHKICGVERGCEVITTFDGPTIEIKHAGIIANRQQALQIFERCLGRIPWSFPTWTTATNLQKPLFTTMYLFLNSPSY